MTVTISRFSQSGFVGEVEYASDLADPLFRIWIDGVLATTTTATRATVPLGSIVDVLDTGLTPPPVFPPRLTLRWDGVAGAAKYRVEEFVDGAWVPRASVPDDGTNHYRFRTRVLEDGVTHAFRIVPVGTNGNDGTAKTVSALVVRNPDPPTVAFSYNPETQKLTVTGG